jgi:ankyrin repeat protein
MKTLTMLALFLFLVSSAAMSQSHDAQEERNTALIQSAFDGDLRGVEAAIAKGADVDATGPKDRTAMLWAAANGHYEVVEFLHSKNADIDKGDSNGQTPLIFAVRGSHVDIVRFLLDSGAKVDVQSKKQGMTALIAAAAVGNVEVVKLLLEHGADKELVQWNGWSALDRARQFEHPEIIVLLGGEPAENADDSDS